MTPLKIDTFQNNMIQLKGTALFLFVLILLNIMSHLLGNIKGQMGSNKRSVPNKHTVSCNWNTRVLMLFLCLYIVRRGSWGLVVVHNPFQNFYFIARGINHHFRKKHLVRGSICLSNITYMHFTSPTDKCHHFNEVISDWGLLLCTDKFP